MMHTSHTLPRLLNERVNDLRNRAADEAVVAAVAADRRRAKREAALAATQKAASAKQERALFSWQSRRHGFGLGRLRGAR